jgi:hypothetical protein
MGLSDLPKLWVAVFPLLFFIFGSCSLVQWHPRRNKRKNIKGLCKAKKSKKKSKKGKHNCSGRGAFCVRVKGE